MTTSKSTSSFNPNTQSKVGQTQPFSLANPMIVDGEFYIPSDALLAGIKKIVLKSDELFGILDTCGESPRIYGRELGFYYRDTRYLDTWELSINGYAATSLISEVKAKASSYLFVMTNRDIPSLTAEAHIPRDRLHIQRVITLHQNQVYEHILLANYDNKLHTLNISRRAGSFFNDIFEVRGSSREYRGVIHEPYASSDRQLLTLSYKGVNHRLYQTHIWSPIPMSHLHIEGTSVQMTHKVELSPREQLELRYIIAFDQAPNSHLFDKPFASIKMDQHLGELEAIDAKATLRGACIVSANPIVNRAIDMAQIDIATLLTERQGTLYPDAGIPWFCAPFGRDGIITAYQLLPWYPEVAEGVLQYLFTHLGTKTDPFTDEEPGKVLHELRQGEMADLREVPFIPYYGSVDATPLSLILLAEYAVWTGRMDFVQRHWEEALAALQWCCNKIAKDPHGFITYQRGSPSGLHNQGWKDSHDSIMHCDGRLAEPPIALCEVQAYTYRALVAMASLSRQMGLKQNAESWLEEAELLRKRFLQKFWDGTRRMLALALDQHGKPCQVLASNQGHCLWSGIVTSDQAMHIARHLLSPSMFSGHGVRTLGTDEIAYNPLSYHNGSIWPHDNSLIAAGLRIYDRHRELQLLAEGALGVLEASDDFRLPELFCGFPKYGNGAPVPYDVACKPQAWAAGSLFLLLRSLLGMCASCDSEDLQFTTPILPRQIPSLEVQGLPFKGQILNFVVRQGQYISTVELTKRSGTARLNICT